MISSLQLRDVHCAIDRAGVDLAERGAVLRDIIAAPCWNGLHESYPGLGRVPAVQNFRRQINNCWKLVERLQRHAQRTTHPQLRSYLGSLNQFRQTFEARCNHRLCATLTKHAAHCESIFNDLQRGRYTDSAAMLCRERLHEELAKDAQDLLRMIGKIDTDPDAEFETAEPEEEADHEKFVKAMEDKFDVSAHRWEPVREGLIVYFDEENTGKLAKALGMQGDQMQPNDEFAEFCDEHGYLMIRRGMPQDIKFGGFPSAASRWIFVYSPKTIEDPLDPEEIEDKDEENKKDLKKRTDQLIKDIEKLRVDGKGDGPGPKAAARLGTKKGATAGISGTIHPSGVRH